MRNYCRDLILSTQETLHNCSAYIGFVGLYCNQKTSVHNVEQFPLRTGDILLPLSLSPWSGMLVAVFGYVKVRTSNFWSQLNWSEMILKSQISVIDWLIVIWCIWMFQMWQLDATSHLLKHHQHNLCVSSHQHASVGLTAQHCDPASASQLWTFQVNTNR